LPPHRFSHRLRALRTNMMPTGDTLSAWCPSRLSIGSRYRKPRLFYWRYLSLAVISKSA
jgi:hypothetical protein